MESLHPARPGRGERLALGLLLALFVLTGLSLLPLPFTRDQGVYAYTAWRWTAGGVPYVDAFDHKGPLLYAVYALGLALAGGQAWGVNLLDLLARLLALGFTWATARRLFGPRAAWLATALAALPLTGAFDAAWVNAQAESFMLPLLAAAGWLCVGGGGNRRDRAAALAGLLAAQAVMLKPTAALTGLFLAGWLAAGDRTWRRPALFAGAALAGVAAWLAYFAARGALGRMWESLVVFNTIHARAGAGPAWTWVPRLFGFAPLLAAGLALPGRSRRARLFAAGWLAAGVLQVVVQGKFFAYHWLAAVLPLGLAAGAGLDTIAARLDGAGRRTRLGLGFAAAVVLALAVPQGAHWARTLAAYRTWDRVTGRITPAEYAGRFREAGGDFNLLASTTAAAALRDQTPPGARVLVFGFEPLVNWLARRPSPTRFVFDYPLTFTPTSDRAARLRDRWRAEFMAGLRARPPEVVVLVDRDVNPLETTPSVAQAAAWPEFAAWLRAGYAPAGELEDFKFFTRR
ncbi:MAG: glycosyltransferase family 39 protein [Candidatus Krumholzibacteriia bacterium]